jgi:hypothetical protein
VGEFTTTILAGLAQMERTLIGECTRAAKIFKNHPVDEDVTGAHFLRRSSLVQWSRNPMNLNAYILPFVLIELTMP